MPKGGLVSPERWFQERLCEDLLAGGSSVEELEASFRCEISGANARTKKAALAGKTPLAVRAEHLRQQKMERGHNIHSWDLPYFLLKNVMGSTTFCKSGNELFSPPSMVLDDILLGGSTIDDVKSANGNVQNTRFDGQVCNGPTGQRKERLKVDPSPAILRTLQQDLRRAVAHEKEQRDAAVTLPAAHVAFVLQRARSPTQLSSPHHRRRGAPAAQRKLRARRSRERRGERGNARLHTGEGAKA
jgi:hypothetical protein